MFRQKATAFWDYHDFMFAKQAEITTENVKAKIEEFAKSKNLDMAQMNLCTASKSAEAEVEKSVGSSMVRIRMVVPFLAYPVRTLVVRVTRHAR